MDDLNVKICKECNAPSGYVYETRVEKSGILFRRRICPFCGSRWKTAEIPYELAIKLLKEKGIISNEKVHGDINKDDA